MKFKSFKQLTFLSILALALLISGCSSTTSKIDEKPVSDLSVYENADYFISAKDLNEMLEDDNLVLLDCNKPDLYQKSHIPGAIGIGLHAFSDKVGKPGDAGWGTIKSKDDLELELIKLGIDDTKTVVLYSNVFKGPGADGRAAWQLNLAGMDNVKILMGGSSYWWAEVHTGKIRAML